MDPNSQASSISPELQAKLDRVMSTPTPAAPPPASASPMPVTPQAGPLPVQAPQTVPVSDQDMLLSQSQDANALHMPPPSQVMTPPAPITAPAAAVPGMTTPTSPLPTPSQATTLTQLPKKGNNMKTVLFIVGGLIFFTAYTFVWILILNPSLLGK